MSVVGRLLPVEYSDFQVPVVKRCLATSEPWLPSGRMHVGGLSGRRVQYSLRPNRSSMIAFPAQLERCRISAIAICANPITPRVFMRCRVNTKCIVAPVFSFKEGIVLCTRSDFAKGCSLRRQIEFNQRLKFPSLHKPRKNTQSYCYDQRVHVRQVTRLDTEHFDCEHGCENSPEDDKAASLADGQNHLAFGTSVQDFLYWGPPSFLG